METIAKTYAYHKPSEEGLDKIQKLRAEFSALDNLIKQICPVSRELSVAITNLETTAMWAIKSVVCNDPCSEIEQPQVNVEVEPFAPPEIQPVDPIENEGPL